MIVVGASTYNARPQPRNSIIPEGPDLNSLSRLTGSSQSLHAIFSLTSPSLSASQPYLEQYAIKTPASHASLDRLNHFPSNGNISITKTSPPGDSINKSSDEYTGSTCLSNLTSIIPSDINSHRKHMPIEIRVRCIFLRVGEIDTLNERYTSEIFFEASWYTKDLKNGIKYDPQAGHFNPQLFVLNHMGDSLRHDVCRK